MGTVWNKTWGASTVAVAAISLHLWAVYLFASDWPFLDDYDAVLGFFNDWVTLPPITARWERLLDQYNEHRLLVPRLLEATMLHIHGQIQLRSIIWAGQVGWLLTLGFFWQRARPTVSFSQFTPVVLLWTSFSQHELMTWAMASVQQYWQLFLALTAISAFLANAPARGLLLFTLSTFTGGGGWVIAPTVLGKYWLERKWRVMGVVLLWTSALAWVYFPLAYPSAINPPPPLMDALSHPVRLAAFAMGFLGSVAKSRGLSIVLGSALSVLFMLRLNRIRSHHPQLFWCMLFLVGTAFAAAVGRSGLEVQDMAASRYTPYSLAFISLLYVAYLATSNDASSQQRVYRLGLFFSGLIFVYWLVPGIHRMESRFNRLEAREICHPRPEAAKQILNQSRRLGIFATPTPGSP